MSLEQSLERSRPREAGWVLARIEAFADALKSIPTQPKLDIANSTYYVLFAVLIATSAMLQYLLFHQGLYSISADESARAIFAHNLTFDNAFELTFWTPLNKILNGLALKLHDDLFVTPRILNGLLGLATLAALVTLTQRLFHNRLVALIAGVLALALPQRLILSIAPLSDMEAYFFTLLGAAFLVTWFQTGTVRSLIIASALLLLASMVRFESWFLNALLGLYLAYRCLIKRDLAFVPFVLAGFLLSVFPLYWLAKIYLLDGSFARLGMTSIQFMDTYGRNYVQAMKFDALFLFVKDIVTNPGVLLGTAGLMIFGLKERNARLWIGLVFAPLFILGVMMIVSLSVPMAAPFRIDGIWVLLVLPFAAWLMVTAADHFKAPRLVRGLAVGAMVYIGFMTSLLATHNIVKDYYGNNLGGLIIKEDLVMGHDLRAILAKDPRNVVVDAIDNLAFLNAATVANAPERMIANVDADLVITGIYSTARQKYVANHQTDIIDTYLTDRFNIEGGLTPAQLKARNIGYFLLRNANYIAAANANPLLTKRGEYGAWVLYEVHGV